MQIPSTARRFLFKYLWSLFSSCKIASEHPDDFKMCYSCHRTSSCTFISELNTFQFSNPGHLSVDVQTSHQCFTAPTTSCLCPRRSLWLHCLLSKTLCTLSELLFERGNADAISANKCDAALMRWCECLSAALKIERHRSRRRYASLLMQTERGKRAIATVHMQEEATLEERYLHSWSRVFIAHFDSSLIVFFCLCVSRRCTPKVWSWPVQLDMCVDTATTSSRSSPPFGPSFSGLKEKVQQLNFAFICQFLIHFLCFCPPLLLWFPALIFSFVLPDPSLCPSVCLSSLMF